MTIEELIALVEQDYVLNGRKSIRTVRYHAEPLRRHFLGQAVETLDGRAVLGYVEARLKAGRSRKTANNEIALLRRAFNLALDQGLVKASPRIRLLHCDNVRSGFLRPTDYGRLNIALRARDEDVADLIEWLYHLGWRRGEAIGLRWDEVDLAAGAVELAGRRTKNGEAKLVKLDDSMRDLLRRRNNLRNGDLVFHRRGKPIVDFRVSWRAACRAIGRPGLLVHDLRRSFARNGIQAGVHQMRLMRVAGWKTDSVFRRYCIIDEADIAEAVAKVSKYVRGEG